MSEQIWIALCHDCGTRLTQIEQTQMWWCDRCKHRRRTPTHPALWRYLPREAVV